MLRHDFYKFWFASLLGIKIWKITEIKNVLFQQSPNEQLLVKVISQVQEQQSDCYKKNRQKRWVSFSFWNSHGQIYEKRWLGLLPKV
jgi:hypothetical protein